MGASCSINIANVNFAKNQPKTKKFRTKDLRAPMFSKLTPEKVDSKAYRKYCSDEITKNWMKVVYSDDSNEKTFEEYRKSCLAAKMLEHKTREAFIQLFLNGNVAADIQDYRLYKVDAHLLETTGQITGQHASQNKCI